jgi:hypothetical protein
VQTSRKFRVSVQGNVECLLLSKREQVVPVLAVEFSDVSNKFVDLKTFCVSLAVPQKPIFLITLATVHPKVAFQRHDRQ